MTTLTTPPVAPLLNRLFTDADLTTGKLREMFAGVSPAERLVRMADANANYRAFYTQVKDIHMPVSRETGRLLYMLVRAMKATSIVEFGTSFGISTLHLASGVRDNGGGRVIGSEFEPGKLAAARANLKAAGLDDLVEIREGDALETLSRDLPERIDFVLLDGHKPLYSRVLDLLAPRLRAGACIVADNADACPPYLARVREPNAGWLSVPFADDVELSVKV